MAVFPTSTREYAIFVEALWKDRAFQATFDRRNEIQRLPRVANYFLNRVRSCVMFLSCKLWVLYAQVI